jgi:hypothetical protein
MCEHLLIRIPGILLILLGLSAFAQSQELDPRAYQPAPVGFNGLTLGYNYSSGDVVFEPAVPVEDAQARLNFGAAAYYRSFGLFGRFANALVAIPYAAGHLNGTLEGAGRREIYRSGLSDLNLRFAINLRGTPAMKLPEFIKHKNKANLGVSLRVSAPTGQYDPEKIINIGQNRWGFKPEVGLSKFFKKWQIDAYAGVWLFTANNNFQGKTRTQDPITSLQFHLTYNLRPAFWFGFNANFYSGGLVTTDGVPGTIKQNNSRIGGTISVPIARGQSLKISVSRGVIVSRGGDFTNLGVAYNYAW